MTISLKHSFNSAVADGSFTWTGTITSGTNTITSVSPTPTSAIVGYRLYNANIPSGTTVSSVSGSTITMSANATGSASGATFYTDDGLVQASDWNAEHALTLAANRLLGRSSAGAGVAEEISIGTGLSLSGGTLSATAGTVTLTPGTTATSGGAAGQIMFDTGSVLQESADLVWDNVNDFLQIKNNAGSYQLGASSDVRLTRRGAANLRFGAADAAAPVAQTLSVQSVVAGTSNTAGANLTITGSQGTGTGAGGSMIFQVAFGGSSGTAQNALVDALTISAALQCVNINNPLGQLNIQRNGTTRFSTYFAVPNQISITNDAAYGWVSGTTASGANDTNLTRRAAGVVNVVSQLSINSNGYLTSPAAARLQLGQGDAAAPVAQTLSVQSVVAGTSNTAGANLTITGSQGTGTGAGGDIIFQTALAGTSGTAQNTLTTALRIYSNQTVAVGKAYTVATLPAAGTQGRRAWVTDATAPTFLGALIGGGAVVCPVFDNGTAWVAG